MRRDMPCRTRGSQHFGGAVLFETDFCGASDASSQRDVEKRGP